MHQKCILGNCFSSDCPNNDLIRTFSSNSADIFTVTEPSLWKFFLPSCVKYHRHDGALRQLVSWVNQHHKRSEHKIHQWIELEAIWNQQQDRISGQYQPWYHYLVWHISFFTKVLHNYNIGLLIKQYFDKYLSPSHLSITFLIVSSIHVTSYCIWH